MAKFLLVTAVNVMLNQLVLFMANSLAGMPGGKASAVAAAVGVGPAYLMARYWVWSDTNSVNRRQEILIFAAIALAGLVVSSVFAELADRTFGSGLMVNAANFVGYFLVWIAKFFLLDRLFTEPPSPTRN